MTLSEITEARDYQDGFDEARRADERRREDREAEEAAERRAEYLAEERRRERQREEDERYEQAILENEQAEAESLVGLPRPALAVDGKTDLCLRMMGYAAFDDRHGDLRPSQVRDNLSVFFPQETIQAAENLFKEGWIPPRVDLSFYSANVLEHPTEEAK